MNKVFILSRQSITLNLFFKEFTNLLVKKEIEVILCCNNIKELNISHNHSIDLLDSNYSNFISKIYNYLKLIYRFYKISKKYNDYIFIINTTLISHLFRFSTFFRNIKIIYFVHGYRFHNQGNFFKNYFFKFLEIVFSYNTLAYININSYDYDFTINQLKKKSLKIKGVGIDLKDKSYQAINPNRIFNIGVIGAYKKNKGYNDLIKIAQNKNLNKNIKFECYGYGNNSKYKFYLKKFNLNNVNLNSFTTNIFSAINKFDILLHLSYREGLPVSLMQCLIRGKPVICYNIRGCVDLISDGKNGYIIELGNIEKVIDKINYLSNNKENINNLSINAYETINDEYSSKHISQKILNYIQNI